MPRILARSLAHRAGLIILMAALAGAGGLAAGADALAAAPSPRVKPAPPPPSAYISRSDHNLLATAAESARNRDYAAAKSAARAINDPAAKDLAEWFYYDAGDPNLDIQDATAFLDAHAGWPSATKIQSAIEGRMTDLEPAKRVLAFFEHRDPITGEGKLQLARALFAVNRPDAAIAYVKDAWINDNWLPVLERKILSNYGRYLTAEDHAKRVDQLLWNFQISAAQRLLSRLEPDDRRLANARIALLSSTGNAWTLYGNLSEKDRLDSGVLYAAVRYQRRHDHEAEAIELAQKLPDDPAYVRNSSRWWDERGLLARWALKNGRFSDAYAMAAGHGLSDGLDYAEAEFFAGWVALRFLNDPDRAGMHFAALERSVSTPISNARAHYWRARAAEAGYRAAQAAAQYRLAASYPYTYYGQLAEARLPDAAAEAPPPPVTPTPEERAAFEARPLVHALHLIAELDEPNYFRRFAYFIDDTLDTAPDFVALGELALASGYPEVAVRVGKTAAGKNIILPHITYPVIAVPARAEKYADPALILGLSRQESEFNPRAYSRAGARGVMQLRPSTALAIARRARIPYHRDWLMDDPGYNITLGSVHLGELVDSFNGSYIVTLAAYNAGPNRAARWIQEYGDPRAPDVDPVDWVEMIPFSETRNYVQRVLENTEIYRALLAHAPIDGTRLAADLTRGGKAGRAGAVSPPSPVLVNLSKLYGPQTLPDMDLRAVSAAVTAQTHSETPVAEATAETLAQAAPATAPKPAPKAVKQRRRPPPETLPIIRSAQADPAPEAAPEATQPTPQPQPVIQATPSPEPEPQRTVPPSTDVQAADAQPAPATNVAAPDEPASQTAQIVTADANDTPQPVATPALQSEAAPSQASPAIPQEPVRFTLPQAAQPEPEPAKVLGPANLHAKTPRARALLKGAVETTDCNVFLPDDSGGGTCIDPKPEANKPPEERRVLAPVIRSGADMIFPQTGGDLPETNQTAPTPVPEPAAAPVTPSGSES